MISSENLTPKIINLPISPIYCDRTTLRSAKELYFNNDIYIFFKIFRSSMNKTDYNCHNADVSELSLHYNKFSNWPSSSKYNYGVCYATVRWCMTLCWNQIQVHVSTSCCHNLTTCRIGARYTDSFRCCNLRDLGLQAIKQLKLYSIWFVGNMQDWWTNGIRTYE